MLEDWELDFEILKVKHRVKDALNRDKLPDLQSILFLIGIQELGSMQDNYTKEEKQDLIHVAVCTLLSYDGYYEFQGRDADGWPHFKLIKPIPPGDVGEQEKLLSINVVRYFNELENQN